MSTQIKMSIFKLTASSKSELIKIYILFQISVWIAETYYLFNIASSWYDRTTENGVEKSWEK